MDKRFDAIQSHPANQVFHVVFFPDRIYHAQYLNATVSSRYTYNVQEVRGKIDATVLKGQLRLDEQEFTNFLRVEYRAGRLVEGARVENRFVCDEVIAYIRVESDDLPPSEGRITLCYCPWVDAFQCEIWQSLECVPGQNHDYKVIKQMGRFGSITSIPSFQAHLADPRKIRCVQLAFREGSKQVPGGYFISDQTAAWDNFYGRNIQVPNSPVPNDHSQNTVPVENYHIDFQRGWYIEDISTINPVRYRNAMMLDRDLELFAQRFFNGDIARMNETNITEMRWIFQRELGSNLVFFHEVTVPVGGVEGTHQHIGSEELYYITEGNGLAYLSENDDPILAANDAFPTVEMPIFGLNPRRMKEVPVKPGAVIFTKSGGMHGIRNTGDKPLKFVAFLYHSH